MSADIRKIRGTFENVPRSIRLSGYVQPDPRGVSLNLSFNNADDCPSPQATGSDVNNDHGVEGETVEGVGENAVLVLVRYVSSLGGKIYALRRVLEP